MKRLLYFFVCLLTIATCVAQDITSEEVDGQPVGREVSKMFLTAGAAIKAPVPEKKPDPDTQPLDLEGGHSLSVLSYAYCLRGVTASGRYTKHGTIAVDPRVIPLGSRLYVPGYGWGIAADTGGLISGNKIDLWKPTARDCYNWGVRRVTIKVFPPR